MEHKKNKVVAAGHICLDITPVFSSGEVSGLDEILTPGKLVQMKEADVHTGGSVANTGLAMKFFGNDIQLMGKVGKDPFGDMVLTLLEQHHAAKGMIVASDAATSYSIVLAVPGIDRIFLHNPGANDTFSYKDIDFTKMEDVRLFHFGYPPIMEKIYKNDGEELVKIFGKVKEMGIASSLDMAAVDPTSQAGKVDWEKILQRVLPLVDFFVPSIEELGFMLNRSKYNQWIERAKGKDITEILSIKEDVKPLADRLIMSGAAVVLIKCGAKGIYYKTGSKERISTLERCMGRNFEEFADREGLEKSYKPERILSATGAGDTSIAAFLTAVLEGYSLEQCLKLATATGASCVAAYDALSGLQPLEELQLKIEEGWEKQ